jgi:hypothetical protein
MEVLIINSKMSKPLRSEGTKANKDEFTCLAFPATPSSLSPTSERKTQGIRNRKKQEQPLGTQGCH